MRVAGRAEIERIAVTMRLETEAFEERGRLGEIRNAQAVVVERMGSDDAGAPPSCSG